MTQRSQTHQNGSELSAWTFLLVQSEKGMATSWWLMSSGLPVLTGCVAAAVGVLAASPSSASTHVDRADGGDGAAWCTV